MTLFRRAMHQSAGQSGTKLILRSERSQRSRKKSRKKKHIRKFKFLVMVRDALGGTGRSSLSMFTVFSNMFEKLKIQNIKIGQNPFKMR